MDTQVLKPGGFWICPTCGQRNKVWAPCSHCGTALSDMAIAADEPRPPGAGRRSPWLYVFAAAGVAAAIALAFALTRLLGGPALAPDDVPERAARAARPIAPPADPIAPGTPQPAPPLTTVPQIADAAPGVEVARPSEIAPSPPAAVYGPYGGLRSPGYSIPAPGGPRDESSRYRADGRAAGDLRARAQAVRMARDRFARAERALAAAEGGDADVEATAMEELEGAARDLREAEAALDRARRRPPRS